MIGAKSFTIEGSDLMKGMSSSAYINDGGFSQGGTSKTVINPIAVPGLLHAPGAVTDKSTNLVGEMIASCEDPLQGNSRLLLARDSSTQDGTFYYMDSNGALTLKRTDSTNNYIFGKTDMAGYKSEVYATSAEAITRWVPDTTFNVAFFTFSDSAAPHPILVYEDAIYYGDGNLLLRQTDSGGATPATILTLPSNQVIIALGIDPGSGKILISIVDELNGSNTINAQASVGYYDGFSNKLTKKVNVDDMVTAFYTTISNVFVTYGQNLGYWNGAGIQFLRKLDLSFDNTVLAYKHHITNIGRILYVIEKTNILAYGEIVKGQGEVFWYALRNDAGDSGNYSMITNIGQNRLGLGFATTKFYTFDTMSVSAVKNGGAIWYSHRYDFDKPVTYMTTLIEYTSAIPSNDNIASLYLISDTGEANATNVGTVTATRTGQLVFEANYPDIETRSMQLRYTIAPGTLSNVFPVKRFTVFYTPKE